MISESYSRAWPKSGNTSRIELKNVKSRETDLGSQWIYKYQSALWSPGWDASWHSASFLECSQGSAEGDPMRHSQGLPWPSLTFLVYFCLPFYFLSPKASRLFYECDVWNTWNKEGVQEKKIEKKFKIRIKKGELAKDSKMMEGNMRNTTYSSIAMNLKAWKKWMIS